ncbi:hypothetical protein DFJ77DRAFT_468483 [Powellomyces hirtus]|nr:hypothetical protein DFJ77DRAFT_468483 [Powellomyces hirtus]
MNHTFTFGDGSATCSSTWSSTSASRTPATRGRLSPVQSQRRAGGGGGGGGGGDASAPATASAAAPATSATMTAATNPILGGSSRAVVDEGGRRGKKSGIGNGNGIGVGTHWGVPTPPESPRAAAARPFAGLKNQSSISFGGADITTATTATSGGDHGPAAPPAVGRRRVAPPTSTTTTTTAPAIPRPGRRQLAPPTTTAWNPCTNMSAAPAVARATAPDPAASPRKHRPGRKALLPPGGVSSLSTAEFTGASTEKSTTAHANSSETTARGMRNAKVDPATVNGVAGRTTGKHRVY